MRTLEAHGRAGGKPRFAITHVANQTIVALPVERGLRHIFKIVVLSMVIALGGAFAMLLSIAGPRNPAFYTVWLTCWTVGMAGLAFYLLWTLFGVDRLVIRPAGVSRVRSVFGVPYTQSFTPAEALSIRFVGRDIAVRYTSGGHRIPIPALVLANRDRYVSFARGITRKEADAVLRVIAVGLGTRGAQ